MVSKKSKAEKKQAPRKNARSANKKNDGVDNTLTVLDESLIQEAREEPHAAANSVWYSIFLAMKSDFPAIWRTPRQRYFLFGALGLILFSLIHFLKAHPGTGIGFGIASMIINPFIWKRFEAMIVMPILKRSFSFLLIVFSISSILGGLFLEIQVVGPWRARNELEKAEALLNRPSVSADEWKDALLHLFEAQKNDPSNEDLQEVVEAVDRTILSNGHIRTLGSMSDSDFSILLKGNNGLVFTKNRVFNAFINGYLLAYKDERHAFQRQVREEQEKEKIEKARERLKIAAEEREKAIKKQFSFWDGSHGELEDYIKDRMLDPDTYEHINTSYTDNGDFLIVRTCYRGSNAFGARVPNCTTAKVDMDGDIISILR